MGFISYHTINIPIYMPIKKKQKRKNGRRGEMA